MTITLNTIYNSYVAKKNKDYASTPLSKVVSYEEKAVGIDNHFVAEDGIVWIGQTIDFIPANVCLLLHCNSKGFIGQLNCNHYNTWKNTKEVNFIVPLVIRLKKPGCDPGVCNIAAYNTNADDSL